MLALEPADGVGAKSGDVLGTEVINVARGGEADRCGETTQADRQIEIAVEQAVPGSASGGRVNATNGTP
jgi:hypothetical protein